MQVRKRRQRAQRGGVAAAYAAEVEPLEGLGRPLGKPAELEERAYDLVVALVRQVREDRLERGELAFPISPRTASPASSSGESATPSAAACSLTRA